MELLEKLLSVPKSLYVSIKLCGLTKGIKLPIFVRYNTVLRDISGRVIAPSWGGGMYWVRLRRRNSRFTICKKCS